ncbi:MAG: hypothetical protein A2V88_08680 [Elusimicrobia bacterium RBG_16_66_12]|nr:MAG: hypothetical protein A2V88_08680 [Elusimicrobia bacterium RBG_16_66_12]
MTRCGSCQPNDPCEKHWQATVIALAKLCGWRVYHTLHSIGSEPGFPDLILLRGDEMIACELKRQGRKPSDAQEAWLAAFDRVENVSAFCWQPEHWPLIEAALGKPIIRAEAP